MPGSTDTATVTDINDNCVCALPSLSLIRVTGEDRLEFLHSQLTRDLHKLEIGQAGLSAWCNPKGRVIATLLLCHYADHVDLIVAGDLKDAVLKRLRMFVLRSRVKLTDSTDQTCIGISGEASEALLTEWLKSLEPQEWSISHTKKLCAVRIPGPAARFLVYGQGDDIDPLWQACTATCRPVSEAQWTLLNIETGLPWIDQAVSEQFLPQMLNLDRTGGLDFNKGCYPGQEVIARLHYRGEVKQRLRYGTTDSSSISPGDALYNNSGERAGTVVNAVTGSDGRGRCLAVASVSATSLYLGDANGPAVDFSA
ncbi:MAG: hypothetical protein U5P41_09890 [Gammaproteobacteria bacterium]|nr:hypothetical protein [Gammaproteobacteria bacterium]